MKCFPVIAHHALYLDVAVAAARACTGAVPLRPPVDVMLARPVWTLPDPDSLPVGCVYEPKWDGFLH
jgi:hypothetical protein